MKTRTVDLSEEKCKRTVLFVNGCVRPEGVSRTLKIARDFLGELAADDSCVVEEVCVEKENILPLNWERLQYRNKFVSGGDYSDGIFRFAKQFAAADEIVIAAPYWDMSFPASLKAYFEQVSVSGITFYYNDENQAVGLCRAKKITYITTAGGPMYYNGGFEYVKGLCSNLFGIREFQEIKQENLDAV